MAAEAHLAQFNVTVEQARNFIITHLTNLPHIVSVCQQFGITNEMLAEIYGGGITSDAVINFFGSRSIDSTVLDTTSDNTSSTDSSSLVGTWIAQDFSQGIGSQSLTFNSDGSYISNDFVSNLLPGEINGTETGTYNWDSTTGVLSTQVVNDNNGTLGLNQGDANTITLNSDGSFLMAGGGESHTFTKVNTSTQSIVGNWFIQEENNGTNTVYFSIFEDGTYAWSEDVANAMTGESDGIERGTYTWDSTTGNFTTEVTSDENGKLAFSGTTSTQISTDSNGRLAVTMDGEQYSFIPAEDAGSVNSNLEFSVAELAGNTIYNVFKDSSNEPWKVQTMEFFDNGTLNAEDGFVDSPDQYAALPFEITEQGYLKYYLNSDDEVALDVVAKVTNSSLYSKLSHKSVYNPENGFAESVPDWIVNQHEYNQSLGITADTQQYYFYNLSDAMLFVG